MEHQVQKQYQAVALFVEENKIILNCVTGFVHLLL